MLMMRDFFGGMNGRKAQSQILSVVIITGILVAIIGTSYMWGVPLMDKSRSNSDNIRAEEFMLRLKQAIDDVAETGEQKTLSEELTGKLQILDDGSINYQIETYGLSIATTAWVPLAGGSSPLKEDMVSVVADGSTLNVNINGDETCDMRADCGALEIELSGCTPGDIDGSYSEGETFNLDGDTYTVHHIDCDGDIDSQALIVGPERENAGITGVDEAGVLIAKSQEYGDAYLTDYRLVYRELDDINSPNRDGYKIVISRDGNNLVSSGNHKISIRRGDDAGIDGRSKYGGDLIVTDIYVSLS